MNDKPIQISGIAWAGQSWGKELDNLDKASFKDYLKLIVDNGFNAIRLMVNVDLANNLETYKVQKEKLPLDPDLQDMTAGEFLDHIVDEFKTAGLLVMMNMHNLDIKQTDLYGHWAGGPYSSNDFITAWKNITTRLADKPNVFAMDIFNEPFKGSKWGGGGPDDWATFAETVGNEILKINSNVIICVEGVEASVEFNSVIDRPIKLSMPNKVIYSPHNYDMNAYGPTDMKEYFDKYFGILYTNNLPVVIGEYGFQWTQEQNYDMTKLNTFIEDYTSYMKDKNQKNFFYWAVNPQDKTTVFSSNSGKLEVKTDIMNAVTKVQGQGSLFTF
jgi:aryl-phospho-beta-D-glucosidase BglC (GH1 family)